MPLLNTAEDLRLGTAFITRAYRDDVLVWERPVETAVVLSLSSSVINAGASVTLTATADGVPSNSTVNFRSGSPTGPIVGTDSSAPWQAVVTPSATTTYYAELIPPDPYLPAISASKTVTVAQPTSISLAVSSGSIYNGDPVTLTATVTGATSGTVRFRTGSPTGPIVASDTASPWQVTLYPTASVTYYATYEPPNNSLQASSSTGQPVTVTNRVTTSISLSSSATTINNGQSVTLTATVSGIPAGQTISFRSGSTTGPVVGSSTVSGTTATLSVSPTSSTTYYATYAGSGAYLPSNSGARSITVRQLVSKTYSAVCSWSQPYKGDGGKRTDTDDCYYGYYSSTWGNQRSLIGWDVPAEIDGCEEITEITLKFYNLHHYYNSGGKLNAGWHTRTSAPNSWTVGGGEAQTNTWDVPKTGWSERTLGSGWRDAFRTGGAKGFAFGPGVTTSNLYYGYAAGRSSGTSLRPTLTIKYKVWE